MNLQTKVNITPPDFLIDYRSKLMLLGSCFAENMGNKFTYYKFDVDVNPCGIVYNPYSVANVLHLMLDKKKFQEKDLLQENGKWISLCHHSCFSDKELQTLLDRINGRLEQACENLRRTDLLVITWGTSWIYKYIKTGTVVSNCHKIPAKEFVRYRLGIGDIVNEYVSLIHQLREVNPDLRVMFTVSPIRHWKDGADGNQLSKATLLLAIDQIREAVDQVYYFPAYEIVLDELRDYRFYAEDMLHLTPFTVDYIWERLLFSYISPDVLGVMNTIGRINKGMAHRPFDVASDDYQTMVRKLLATIREVSRIHPTINFASEIKQLEALLTV